MLQEEEEAFGELCSRRKFHDKEAPLAGDGDGAQLG